jgi:hypothetical protein
LLLRVGKTVEKRQCAPRVVTARVWQDVVKHAVEDDTILRAMARFEPVQQIVLIRRAHFVPMAWVGKYQHELQGSGDPNVPVTSETLTLASLNVSLYELPLHVLRRFGRKEGQRSRRELAAIVPNGVNQRLVPQPRIRLLMQNV